MHIGTPRGATGLLGLAAVVAACGSDPVAPKPLTPADVVGAYALASINGQRLPAPYGQGSAAIYDTLTLGRDSTWTDRYGGGDLGSSVVTYRTTYTGRWALDAAAGRVLITETPHNAKPVTYSLTVVERGAALLGDTGSANPANPGGGPWVYNRVP